MSSLAVLQQREPRGGAEAEAVVAGDDGGEREEQ